MIAGSPSEIASPSRFESRCWPKLHAEIADAIRLQFASETIEKRSLVLLLPPQRENIVPRIRDAKRLDVQQLMETQTLLQRWRLATSATFPLADGVRSQAASWLGASESGLGARGSGARAFIEAVKGAVEIFPVEEERQTFRMGPCRAEATRVAAEGEVLARHRVRQPGGRPAAQSARRVRTARRRKRPLWRDAPPRPIRPRERLTGEPFRAGRCFPNSHGRRAHAAAVAARAGKS